MNEMAVTKKSFKFAQFIFLNDDLAGLEALHDFIDIADAALCNKKLTSRYIQECNSCLVGEEMNACQEVILIVFQHIIVKGHSWGHQFGNTSFHDLFGQFRIFQLVAYGNTLTSTD